MVRGYTAQFGNGFSATLAAEMRRMTQIANVTTLARSVTGSLTSAAVRPVCYGGFQAPDIVGNLRVDQAWGSAQIMGALHQVNMPTTTVIGGPPAIGHVRTTNWAWVIGAGIKLNAPMIGQGDFLQAQVNYTQGALRYIFQTPIPTGAR